MPTWGSQFCILPQRCHCHPNMSPLHGTCPGCRLHAASHCLHFPGHACVPMHTHVHAPPKCMYAQTCNHVHTVLAHLCACTPHLCTPMGKHPHIPTSTPKFAHTFVCPCTHTHKHAHSCSMYTTDTHPCMHIHAHVHTCVHLSTCTTPPQVCTPMNAPWYQLSMGCSPSGARLSQPC